MVYKDYYWCAKADKVDLILVKNGKVIAIEVKSGRQGNNNGLPLFRKQFHPLRSFVMETNGIPVEEFLSMDLTRLF